MDFPSFYLLITQFLLPLESFPFLSALAPLPDTWFSGNVYRGGMEAGGVNNKILFHLTREEPQEDKSLTGKEDSLLLFL